LSDGRKHRTEGDEWLMFKPTNNNDPSQNNLYSMTEGLNSRIDQHIAKASGADKQDHTVMQAQQEQRQRLGIPVTEQEWDIISNTAINSGNQEETLTRFATALAFSRDRGISLSSAYANLDNLYEEQLGEKFTPAKTTTRALLDSFQAGRLNMDYSDLAYKFKQADLAGEDTTELLAQLDAMGNEIESLKDNQPRNIATTALKWTLEGAVPYMLEVGKSALMGATFAGGLGTAFTATTGAVLGSIAAASPYSMAAIMAAGGAVGAVNRTRELMEGVSYLQLRDMGIDKDIANVGSRTYGLLVGAIEAGLGIEAGTVIKATGGSNLVSSAASKVMTRFTTSGKLGSFLQGLAALGINATGEAVEEMIEEPLDYLVRHTSYAIQDSREKGSRDPLPDEELIRNTLHAGLRGFASAIVLGSASSVLDTKVDIDKQAAIRREAAAVPSKEAFVSSMKQQKPDTITTSDWDGAMSDIWDREHSGMRKSSAIESDENAIAELDAEKSEKQATGKVRRLQSGDLYTQEASEVTVSPDGTENRRLLVGDPATSSRYGYIDYGIQGNTITIEDVLVKSGYESIRKEAVLSLAKKYPGYDIQWEPKSESLTAVRDEILAGNPRGNEGGLQYWDGLTNPDERMQIERQIESAMPNLSAPERAVGATLIQMRAEAAGMNTQAYLDASYKDGQLFGNVEDLDVNMQGKRGAVAFDEDLKAIIYAGQKADFSTFAHETFHVSLRQMGQLEQFRSAVTEASQKPEFITWLDEHAELFTDSVFDGMNAQDLADIASGFTKDNWGRRQEEFAARLYEGYLADGKTASSKLQQLFSQIAKWMAQIYTTLKHSVDLDPRIIEVFDSLSDSDSPLASQLATQDTVNQNQEGAQLYQDDTQSQYDAVADQYRNTDQWMKAPNGKPTNLTERQWVQVRTPAFIEWFGDWINDPENASKVVDENGEPKVVYHNTNEKRTVFDINRARKGVEIQAFFFAPEIDPYGEYGKVRNDVFLRVINPADFESAFDGFQGGVHENDGEVQRIRLQEKGFDGGIMIEDGEVYEYFVFNSNQIKSATDNIGTFDGSNSNILFQEAPPTDSEAFKAWFGDSKVVDENGNPLVVYHSTNTEFEAFDTSDKSLDFTIPNNRGDNIGAFFTTSERNSKHFGNNTMEVYLSIQNPKVFDTQDNFREFVRSNFKMEEETLTESAKFSNDTRRILEEQGYDGVIIKKAQFGGKTSKESWYVAFSPTQIKSATGNSGAFDTANPNILFQEAPPLESAAFREWFGNSKIVDDDGKPLVVYHGTDAAFTTFSNTGEKLPSLGYGYYFTPDIRKAQQYGANIMPVYISAERLLDWGSLSNEDRSKIIDRLNDKVPESEIAGYGREVRKSFDDTEEGRQAGTKFFEKKKAETENYFHERAKAREERSLDGLKIDVVWMEPGLENASNQDLLALAQQYDIQIAENLGYDAARFGNEIVVFAPTKIKSVNNQGIWDSNNPNILFQEARETKSLEKRVQGDMLLDVLDLIDEVKQVGADVSDLGIITLYHATSKEAAKNIEATGMMIAKEDGLFFSTKPDGQIVGYGESVVKFEIPAELLEIDDIFDDEAHLYLGIGNRRSRNIAGFGPNILFQDDQDFSESILEEARGFESWQELKAFYEAFADPDNPSSTDDSWYQEVFNQANGITEDADAEQLQEATRQLESEQAKDQYMKDQLATDDGVYAFLRNLGWMLDSSSLKQAEGNQQTSDAIYNVRNMADAMHPSIISNATRAYGGKRPTASSTKRIRTIMTGDAIRYYRDIYADVMEDEELRPAVIDSRLPGIEDPGYRELESMSITERLKLANRIEAAPLRKAILSGKETFEGAAEKVIKDDAIIIGDLNKQISDAEQDIKNLEKNLSEEQKLRIRIAKDYRIGKAELDRELAKLRKLNNDGKDVPKAQSQKVFSLQKSVADMHKEVMKMRKDARLEATIKKHEAVAKLKEQLAEKRKAVAEAKQVRDYKMKLARKIMVKPSDATNYEQAKAIYGIQALIDPNFRRDGVNVAEGGQRVKLTLEEAQEFFSGTSEDEIIDAIGKRNYERLVEERKPLNDWTINELEELANEVAELRHTGRRILAAKRERQVAIAQQYQDSIIRSLMATGKYTDQPIVGTREDQAEKQSPKRTLRAMYYATYPMRVKAMMLDGDRQGDAYNLLMLQKRDAQAREWVNVERRLKPFYDAMKELGFTYKDLYETVPIDLDMHKNWNMPYSQLMYGWLSQYNQDNRNAIAYGTFVTQEEKASLSHDSKLIQVLGDQRYNSFLEQAEYYLYSDEHGGKYGKLLEVIRESLNGDAERINEVAIREFNKPMRHVEQYLPILRLAFNGEDMAEQVAEDLFNQNAGGMRTSVEKGFMTDRIFISPDHQKPVNMDLISVLDQSVRNQEHFIAFAEYGRKLNRVFKDRGSDDLKHVITRTLGSEMMDDINEYINQVINPTQRTELHNLQKGIRFMRGNLGAAYLSFKPSSVLLQLLTSPWPSVIDVKPKYLIQGYLQLLKHPVETVQEINERSPMMKNRTMNVIIDEILKQARAIGDPKIMQQIARIQEVGSLGLTYADRYSVAGQWMGAFHQRMDELNAEGIASEKAEQMATVYADNILLKTQPTGDRTELAPLFNTRNEFVRSFIQFTTSLNVIWSNITYDMRVAANDSMNKAMPDDVRKTQFSKVIGTLVGYGMAGLLLGAVMEGHDEDDDKIDKLRNYIYWSFTQGADSVPLIGSQVSELIRSAVTGDNAQFYSDDFYPGMTKILNGAKYLTQGDISKALENFGKGAGYMVGLPVSGAQQIVDAVREGPEALIGR
jgi:hypothetical protein